jgi:hypothetical protein
MVEKGKTTRVTRDESVNCEKQDEINKKFRHQNLKIAGVNDKSAMGCAKQITRLSK